MAPKKKSGKASAKSKTSKTTKVQVSRDEVLTDKIPADLQQKQSYLNIVLGVLIVIVGAILLFNYFNKPSGNVGPSQQTANASPSQDVAKDQLPGKYTVKEGDTLYIIAQNYYNNGELFTEIISANGLANGDSITVGQVLDIPKVAGASTTAAAPEATASPTPTETPTPTIQPEVAEEEITDSGTGGATNQTMWGEKITENTYTVQPEDWLSKIAGRAYGDIYAYDRIMKENNITNPDLIETGTVLKIPR